MAFDCLFEVVSTIALMVGLLAGNLLQTGKGMTAVAVGAAPPVVAKMESQGFVAFVMHNVPDNFIGAFVKGELLQVVVLAVMVGIGILAILNAAASGSPRDSILFPKCCSRSSTW
jgi:aerobic C4-dicarboxylate transport protein